MKSEEELINFEEEDTSDPEIQTSISRSYSTHRIRCDHCHHNTSDSTRSKKKLIIASLFCLFFMLTEIIGGIISNSIAILCDAAHLLADFASFLISILACWISTRPPTPVLSFGFYRAEVLGALLSILLIWLLTGIFVYVSVVRLLENEFEIDAEIMIVIASLGILANLFMALVLKLKWGGKSGENLNVRAALLHVLGDTIQSLAVLISSLIIYFKPDYKLADPICTLFFSVIILCSTIRIMKDILVILMEGAPKGIDLDEIMRILLRIHTVKKIYNLRVWALSMQNAALSAHIAIEKGADSLYVLQEATNNIKRKMAFLEITLQIEEFSPSAPCCSICEREDIE